jgi:hypothetical protein
VIDPEVAALPHDIGNRGPYVSPGTYTITVDADGSKASTTVRVLADPKLSLTLVQHQEREAFLLQLGDVMRQAAALTERVNAARADLTAKRDALAPGTPERAALETRIQRLTSLSGGGGGRGGRGGGGPAARLGGIASSYNGSGAQQGSLYPPTATHRAQLREVRAALDRLEKELVDISR